MRRAYSLLHDFIGKKQGLIILQKLQKLKPKFDKLSYSDKLKFWEENDLGILENTTHFTNKNEPKPENYISILPNTKEEARVLFNWRAKFITDEWQPKLYDIEKIKENYFEKIKDNIQAIRYTQTQLDKYKKNYKDFYEKESGHANRWTTKPYMKGFDSVVNNTEIDIDLDARELLYDGVSYILQGVRDAILIPFFEEQLLILEEEKKKPKEKVEELEIIPDEIQQRIAWLYSIGIIDYIKEKHKIHSPSTIGKILSKGTGVKWNTIKKTIERIESENLLEKYSDYINNTCQQLKITRVK